MFLIKIILRTIGLVFLAVGIIGVLTPIPFGLVFILISLLFLIPTTPAAVSLVRIMRRRSARFDQMMVGAACRMPFPFRRILRQTEVSDRF